MYALIDFLRDGNSDEDEVRKFIKTGTDVNAKNEDNETALFFAAQSGDEGVIKILLKAGADVNTKAGYGYTPLHLAVLEGADIVRIILKAGADPNALDEFGKTALDSVIKTVNDDPTNGEAIKIIKLLKKYGGK